jgi:hypothetical protein
MSGENTLAAIFLSADDDVRQPQVAERELGPGVFSDPQPRKSCAKDQPRWRARMSGLPRVPSL